MWLDVKNIIFSQPLNTKNTITMIFIYTTYEYLLGEKKVTATTKKQASPASYTLRIFTPARKFLGLPFGGGIVKVSKLIGGDGKVIHARYYSDELKQEVRKFKQELSIPYFQLWKGFLFLALALVIGSVIYSMRNKVASQHREADAHHMIENLQNLEAGQLYGASFFTDENGKQLPELSDGWIKVSRVKADTLFVQRSKILMPSGPVFSLEAIDQFKPVNASGLNPKEEKISLPLIRERLKDQSIQKVDAMYIGEDHDNYGGVVFTIKASE